LPREFWKEKKPTEEKEDKRLEVQKENTKNKGKH